MFAQYRKVLLSKKKKIEGTLLIG